MFVDAYISGYSDQSTLSTPDSAIPLIPVVVGVTIGAVLIIFIIVIVVVCCFCRKKPRQQPENSRALILYC